MRLCPAHRKNCLSTIGCVRESQVTRTVQDEDESTTEMIFITPDSSRKLQEPVPINAVRSRRWQAASRVLYSIEPRMFQQTQALGV
jgi:hypothetical protein